MTYRNFNCIYIYMIQDKLDRQSPIPLYHQLKEILLDLIKSGELEDGRLPTEEELCVRYSVSRGTVRKALSDDLFLEFCNIKLNVEEVMDYR